MWVIADTEIGACSWQVDSKLEASAAGIQALMEDIAAAAKPNEPARISEAGQPAEASRQVCILVPRPNIHSTWLLSHFPQLRVRCRLIGMLQLGMQY